MRVAVVGKGGAGKSVISGTLARVLARSGRHVLALDSDRLPGLSLSLGCAPDPADPPLRQAAARDERGRWGLRKGIGPVRAVQRYATDAPDGIRLLQMGKTARDCEPLTGPVSAFYEVIHGLPTARALRDWSIVGDLPAGTRQVVFNWAPYAETFLLVVEPGGQSALTARRVARILRVRGGADLLFVANRVRGAADVRHVEALVGEPVFASVPADEELAEAERLGIAPIDHAPGSDAVRAIEKLAATLAGGSLRAA